MEMVFRVPKQTLSANYRFQAGAWERVEEAHKMKFKSGRIAQFVSLLLFIHLLILGCETKEEYEKRRQAEEKLANQRRQAEEELLNHLKKVVHECIPLIKNCKTNKSDSDPTIVGKTLVWDMKEDDFSSMHNDFDPPYTIYDNLTVIFILNKMRSQSGVYSITKKDAYRETIIYCIVYWPQKILGGKFTISDDPPDHRIVPNNSSRGADLKLKDIIRDNFTSSGHVDLKFKEKILELINRSKKEK
jgi:hypothetical protein